MIFCLVFTYKCIGNLVLFSEVYFILLKCPYNIPLYECTIIYFLSWLFAQKDIVYPCKYINSF